MRCVPTNWDWDHVSDRSAEQHQCRGRLGDWVDRVPVRQDGLLEPVDVKGTGRAAVVSDDPFDFSVCNSVRFDGLRSVNGPFLILGHKNGLFFVPKVRFFGQKSVFSIIFF